MPIIQITHNLEKDKIKVEYDVLGASHQQGDLDITNNGIRMLTVNVSDEVFTLIQGKNYREECTKLLEASNSQITKILDTMEQIGEITKIQLI